MMSSYDAGFDIGGTRIKYGLVDRDGRLVRKGNVSSPEAIADILAVLETAWASLKKSAPGPIRSWSEAKHCDTAAFGRFHGGLLAEGVYWPPAQFEAAFISVAHDEAVIDRTVAAAAKALQI